MSPSPREAACIRCGGPEVGTFTVEAHDDLIRVYGKILAPAQAVCGRCQTYLIEVTHALADASKKAFTLAGPLHTGEKWNELLCNDVRRLLKLWTGE